MHSVVLENDASSVKRSLLSEAGNHTNTIIRAYLRQLTRRLAKPLGEGPEGEMGAIWKTPQGAARSYICTKWCLSHANAVYFDRCLVKMYFINQPYLRYAESKQPGL